MADCSDKGGSGIGTVPRRAVDISVKVVPVARLCNSCLALLSTWNPKELSMSGSLISNALHPWLVQSSAVARATFPTGAREVTMMDFGGTSSAEHARSPLDVIRLAESESRSVLLTSAGVTHMISPSQNDASSLDGVDPPTIRRNAYFARRTSQCAGTLPSQGAPESLCFGYGLSSSITTQPPRLEVP